MIRKGVSEGDEHYLLPAVLFILREGEFLVALPLYFPIINLIESSFQYLFHLRKFFLNIIVFWEGGEYG